MPRSMTTYASLKDQGEGWSCSMELRSVNSRFCDVSLRMPRWMLALEDRIRKKIQEKLLRGRIELNILLESSQIVPPGFQADVALARSFVKACKELQDELGLQGQVDLALLVTVIRDVIRPVEEDVDIERIWEIIEPFMDRLLLDAIKMAETEGKNLQKDLEKRIDKVSELIEQISTRSEEHTRAAQQAMIQRITTLLHDHEVDQDRLAHEAAILADRLDITEELVRARSHLKQFRQILSEPGLVGRRLDFLIQEIFREVNTMGSKSADAQISRHVVAIKAELEKMREQVQNIQ